MRGQFHLFTCSNFCQQANANHFQLNSPHRSDPSITSDPIESSNVVLDFVIDLPQHFKNDRFFVNVFVTKGSGGRMDQNFQPMLKIRRLGPLVLDTQERGKSFWITDQSVEVYVF